MELTVPYSSAQNGVAEHMNRTLVELLCTMLHGQNVPEFLWDHVVTHATYVRNRVSTRALKDVIVET